MSAIVSIRCAIAFAIILTAYTLDPAALFRIFNGTSLTNQQIEQLANKYNEGVKIGRGKEAGVAFLKSLRGIKEQKSLIHKFLDLWEKDLMLRKIYAAAMYLIEDDITEDLKEEIDEWKLEADKEYKGDFSKSQLSVVRKIVNEVPSSQKEAIRDKLNEPLKSFRTQEKMEKLLAALVTFQDQVEL